MFIVITHINKSSAAYTGISAEPYYVVDVNSNFKITNLFEFKDGLGLTYDPATGRNYALSGFSTGNQLSEICGYSSIPIATLSPPNVALSCLTSGPSGVMALNIASLEVEYGKLDTTKGNFKSLGALPGPYGLYVFAQDNDGLLHYINGAGDYYTSRGPNKKMKIVDDITFSYSICWILW